MEMLYSLLPRASPLLPQSRETPGVLPSVCIGLCAATKLNLVFKLSQHTSLLLKYCIIYLYNSMQILLCNRIICKVFC